MASEIRSDYHRQLKEIDDGVSLELATTEEAIMAASEALLSADPDAITTVALRRDEIGRIHRSLEALVVTQMARQAPVASDLRQLVAVLRTLPEIELSANLANDIARRGAMHLGTELSPRIRGLCAKLFEQAGAMWRAVSDAYGRAPANLADQVEIQHEVVHELVISLMSELTSGVLRPPVLVEMALVARFLERLADHALQAARWIQTLPAPAERN